MSLLDIQNMRIDFPNRHGVFSAVKDVSLHVKAGEILGVIGESGAGKSTIGNAVIGLLQPPGYLAAGQIFLSGERIDTLSKAQMRKLRGKRIGMIFQDPMTSLNPIETIEFQMVETIQEHLPLRDLEAQARAIELLEQVGIPDVKSRIKHYPHQFSGGMRQRVVIALALCAEPDLIIADEPTTALDVSVQAQILELIKTLCKERNVGVLLITHDMGVIAQTADRVAVMYHGELVETGTAGDVLFNPQADYTRALIAAIPPSQKKIDRFAVVSHTQDSAARGGKLNLSTHWLGAGQRFEANDGPLLEINALSKRFSTGNGFFTRSSDYVDAVKDLSFAVKAGESFGLVGESGSGKSTVARLITGIHHPSGGQVIYAGHDLYAKRSRKETRRLRRDIQMVFQDPYSSLNGRMRIKDIIAEPIYANGLATNGTERDSIVADFLDLVGLGQNAARKYPHEFSGGQRQRISIARALATRPRLLICDEPTSALDVSIQAQILNLLKDLQEELNLTMLFISHDLPVIRQMCDHIAVMKRGALLETAPTEQLFEAPEHSYTQSLIRLMPKFVP